TLSGAAGSFTVTDLVTDLDASALTGTLDITTADATSDDEIDITTGSGATSITANADSSDTIAVTASAAVSLTLIGTSAFTVDDAGFAVSVDASGLDEATTLSLSGTAGSFTVTGLVTHLDASALTGTLDVTTDDATTDDEIDITAGSGATSITANADSSDTIAVTASAAVSLTLIGTSAFTVDDAGFAVSVDASGLDEATTLGLSGTAGSFTVTGLVTDLDASALTGTLDVTTDDATTDDEIDITAGSGATSLTASADSSDTIAVTASAAVSLTLIGTSAFTVDDAGFAVSVAAFVLDEDPTLTLSGAAGSFTVTDLVTDLDASALTGTLDITTAD